MQPEAAAGVNLLPKVGEEMQIGKMKQLFITIMTSPQTTYVIYTVSRIIGFNIVNQTVHNHGKFSILISALSLIMFSIPPGHHGAFQIYLNCFQRKSIHVYFLR